mgnify:CR=1 FL=1
MTDIIFIIAVMRYGILPTLAGMIGYSYLENSILNYSSSNELKDVQSIQFGTFRAYNKSLYTLNDNWEVKHDDLHFELTEEELIDYLKKLNTIKWN